MSEKRILITKDADFVNSFLIKGEPWKLLLVSTGNISNHQLLATFNKNIDDIVAGFDLTNFIEINQSSVILHF